jgi:hypothetical protein
MRRATSVGELREAIVEAVATLDEADGSRISTSRAIDAARSTLSEAYGHGFERAVSDYLSDEGSDEDGEEVEDDEDLHEDDRD